MQGGNFAIERSAAPLAPQRLPERSAVNMDWGFDTEGGEEEERPEAVSPAEDEGEGGRRSRRRRRRGRREGRDDARPAFEQPEAGDGHFVAEAENGAPQEPAWEDLEAPASDAAPEPPGVGEQPSIPDEPHTLAGEEGREDRRGRRGRRRGRRGGRRGRDRDGQRAQGGEHEAGDTLGNGNGVGHDLAEPAAAEADAAPLAEAAAPAEPAPHAEAAPVAEAAPLSEAERKEDVAPPAPRSRRAAAAERGSAPPAEAEGAPAPQAWSADRPSWISEAPPARDNGKSEPPPGRDNGKSEADAAPARSEPDAPLPFTPAAQADGADVPAQEEDGTRPIRRGWWQRRFTST